jgi:hypothetical protein
MTDGKVQVLFEDKAFRPLVDAAWAYDKPYPDLVKHVSAVIAQMVNDSHGGIDEKLLAAIFAIWLDKAKLRPDIRVQPTQQVAHVFLRAYMNLSNDEAGLRQLWSVYRSVIERLHGDQMDVARERQAIRFVGEALATAVNQDAKLLAVVDDVLKKFRTGLTADTSDDQHFLAGYYDVRATGARDKS